MKLPAACFAACFFTGGSCSYFYHPLANLTNTFPISIWPAGVQVSPGALATAGARPLLFFPFP